MAQKEVFDLDFEVDSRELDQADKKLRSLDKLLQQTQRRASVLGKTKIAPKITLEDRFTAAADKVERRLSKLQRTTVRPIVGLADGVTAAAARIRASLLGLTGTPWRVRVEGVDWDGVVGGTFSNWMGSKGKETLQQISSSIGSSLGGGLKDIDGKNLDKAPRKANPVRWINLVKEDRELFKERATGSDISQSTQESFGRGIVESKRIKDWGELGNKKFVRSTTEEKDKAIWLDAYNWTNGFFKDIEKEIIKKITTDQLDKRFKQDWDQVVTAWREYFTKNQLKISEKLTPAQNWIFKKALPFLGTQASTVVKKLRLGVAGSLWDMFEIANAKPGKERAQKVGGAIGGTVLGAIGTAIGSGAASIPLGILGATIGDRIGSLIGGGLFDLLYSPKSSRPTTFSDRVMAPSVQGIVKTEEPVRRRVMGTPVPENTPIFSREQTTNINRQLYGKLPKPDQHINMNIPQGAVNLTVSKDELDYEKLAIKAARKLADQIRLSMQNAK